MYHLLLRKTELLRIFLKSEFSGHILRLRFVKSLLTHIFYLNLTSIVPYLYQLFLSFGSFQVLDFFPKAELKTTLDDPLEDEIEDDKQQR